MTNPDETKGRKSSLARRRKLFSWLIPLANLRLTLTLLSCSMVLIFVATLEQVSIGIRGAQAKYFESLFGIWHYPEQFWGGGFLNPIPIPIPGGWLIGGLLILNLTAAFVTRFQWTVKKFGIQLIHLGIIMLLVGQLVTQAIQEESRMQINKGESSNYIERFHGVELALIDVTDPTQETVLSVPQAILEEGGSISNENLPFRINVQSFGTNCDFDLTPQGSSRKGESIGVNRGVGQSANLSITAKDEDYSSEAMNFGFLVFELIDDTGSLGTWLTLAHPAGNHWWKESPKLADLAFQPVRHKGKLWGVSLRSQREYLSFSIKLLGVENEFYQGTETPFNFESDIMLNMENNQTRRALVYMNTPLRHDGKTFYQYQMNSSADYTVFQVIRNPSWLVPYLACIIVSIGLLWQFGFHLFRFLRKNSAKPA
jgi:hypothetical protein